MTPPDRLCRYRPLDASLLDRELGALRNAYLFAPPFSAMNDPMEAFYETGGPGDGIVDALIAPTGRRVGRMYRLLTDMVDRFALISLSSTQSADDNVTRERNTWGTWLRPGTSG